MKKTTLCYIENNNKVLMLFRNKKENDPNEGKWVGVGGKLEKGETPLECVSREVQEETGITSISFQYAGLVHFISDIYEDEDMYLFKAQTTEDEFLPCSEGELKWVPKDEILSLPMWEGDKHFLKKLQEETDEFEMSLIYEGDSLVEVK